jgi:hypothetical protein
MPYREEFLDAFWLPSQFGFGGTASSDPAASERAPATLSEIFSDEERFSIPLTKIRLEHTKWSDELNESNPVRGAVMVKRDRIGFRYERAVGLDDYVSQFEAAKLLQTPVITVNRWVRSGSLPSKKRNRFSVVKLRDVLEVAKRQKKRIRMGGRTLITG